MNNYYRVIWNEAVGAWQAVCEICRSKGKSKSVSAAVMAISSLLVGGQSMAADLPTGGQLVGGTGTITQTSSTMTINQTSAKMAIDWQSFSVGQGKAVNFVQPGTSSVALNRVLGSDVSVIQGAINANGQVFLLNPNGVLFTPTAQVNVGALVASTLKMSTDDFMAGTYKFTGDSANAVINQGNITALGDGSKGGTIALIAAKITNDGNLTANGGQVLLGAGSEAILDLGGPVKLQVTQGAIDALVQNGGAIKADGGLVYLTAQAVDTLTTATINNTGVIRAQTLATGEKGEIRLMGDMKVGTVNVGGTLDASAPNGGDGGFIETSAATVNTQAGAVITAASATGKGGTWLIDPYDYIIGDTAAGAISGALNGGTSVTVTTQSNVTGYGGTGSGNGDITVNSAITKNAGGDANLTLQADRNITVNAAITSTVGKLDINLSAANATSATAGGVLVNANLISNDGNITIGGGGRSINTAGGFALNFYTGVANPTGFSGGGHSSLYGPAVQIGPNVSILSGSGDISISGLSTHGINSPSGYDVENAGIYIMSSGSGAAVTRVNSTNGDVTLNGESAGGNVTFGIVLQAASGSTTFIGSTATSADLAGTLTLNAWNTANAQLNADGALGLTSFGSTPRIFIQGYSAASNLNVKVNGTTQNILFTDNSSKTWSGCSTLYGNCGYLNVPSSNGSYWDAGYGFVTLGESGGIIQVVTPVTSRIYDGTVNATMDNGAISITGDPLNFSSTYKMGMKFYTSSANVGNYTSLINDISADPTKYLVGGKIYTVEYTYGAYTINKAPLGIAVTGIYNGTTSFNSLNSTIVTNGVIAGETVTGVTVNDANVDLVNGNTNYVKTATGTGGFDIGNYQLYTASSLVARNVSFAGGVITNTNNTASITAEPVPVLQPPPAAPVIVPAFPDNGVKAIANEVNPPEFGGMNYVPAKLELAADPQAPVNNQLASTEPAATNAMSYVAITSKVTGDGEELQVRLPEEKGRKPQSEFNVNNTAVATNTSPLDVFVVDTGVNLSGLNKMGNVK